MSKNESEAETKAKSEVKPKKVGFFGFVARLVVNTALFLGVVVGATIGLGEWNNHEERKSEDNQMEGNSLVHSTPLYGQTQLQVFQNNETGNQFFSLLDRFNNTRCDVGLSADNSANITDLSNCRPIGTEVAPEQSIIEEYILIIPELDKQPRKTPPKYTVI